MAKRSKRKRRGHAPPAPPAPSLADCEGAMEDGTELCPEKGLYTVEVPGIDRPVSLCHRHYQLWKVDEAKRRTLQALHEPPDDEEKGIISA